MPLTDVAPVQPDSWGRPGRPGRPWQPCRATVRDRLIYVHRRGCHVQGSSADITDQASRRRRTPARWSPTTWAGDPAVVADASWRRLLRASAKDGHFRGDVVLGTDLLQLPIGAKRRE